MQVERKFSAHQEFHIIRFDEPTDRDGAMAALKSLRLTDYMNAGYCGALKQSDAEGREWVFTHYRSCG